MTGHASSLHELGLSDHELVLPRDVTPDAVYDVVFNGNHAWSLQPTRDTERTARGPVATWPSKLRPFLVGRAEVELRESGSGVVIARGTHVFAGDDDARVSVTARDGTPLILDKYDRLIRPLAAEGTDTRDELLEQVARLLEDLRDLGGVPAFICYGTLLGAVRDGAMIGHDNDIDLAYVSSHEFPVDVLREAYRVERALIEAGWVVRRGMGARINVRIRLADGRVRFVDVFTSHWTEGIYYMPQDTGFELPRSAVLPLGTTHLSGHPMPAPADPEALLSATYGPNWRVPDPSFKYDTPRWLARRIVGWYGGLRGGRKGWDAFYGSFRSSLPKRPTEFAKWVHKHYATDAPMIDLGTGNARDAFWFARRGRRVIAVDNSVPTLNRAASRAAARDLPLEFEIVNFADTRQVVALGTRLARRATTVDLYGRFLLHALQPAARENVLRLASIALRAGGRLFLEFRTDEDADRPHHFHRFGRSFLDPAEVRAQVERHGGRVEHCSAATGLAPFRDEDPHVCRLVATWDRSSLSPAGEEPSTAREETGA